MLSRVEHRYLCKLEIIKSLQEYIYNKEDCTIDELSKKLRKMELFYRRGLSLM